MAIRNVSKDAEPQAAALAANNPWFGAQIAHRFGTEGEFDSNLLAAGQFVYDIPFKITGKSGDATGGGDDATAGNGRPANASTTQTTNGGRFLTKFHLPVVSNFGGKVGPDSDFKKVKDAVDAKVKELLGTASGITAGLFPYYELGKNDNFMFTLHGLMAWRYNSLKPYAAPSATNAAANTSTDDTKLVPLHQIKTGVGLEAVIGDRSDGKGGLTISVTPVMTRFADRDAYKRAFGEERASLGALEVVSVIPINAKGVGVVIEGVAAQGGKRSFRAGLMLVGQP
jgi:hypothetical protein